MQPRGIERIVGLVLSGLAVAFLTLDAVMKLLVLPVVVKASGEIGYSADLLRPLGVILLVVTLLYALPRTAILGAILLTGYLGGAVASHFRHHDPLLSHVLFGAYAGVLVWGGLYLRDGRLRSLLPLRVNPA